MRNLLQLIIKNYFALLFILLEGISLVLIFQFNPYQKSFFTSFSRYLNGYIYSELVEVREYFYLKKDNERLSLENTRLRNTLAKNHTIIIVHKRDSVIIDSSEYDELWQHYYLPAEVVNNSVNKQYNYLTLNKGRKNGIGKDMAVISDGAVVGVVAGVSDNFSTVIPVLNMNFHLGAKIVSNDYFGILEWDGGNPEFAVLQEIPLHVEVKKGDEIITSGYSAIFPRNIKVGKVASIEVNEGNFYNIRVRLYVDFRSLHYVNVIGNSYRKEKQDLEKSFDYD